MSRTGKLPVSLPDKVKASVDGNTVTIEGPKGKLVKKFDQAVTLELKDNAVSVNPAANSRLARAMHGTARSIISGMVKGVVDGYSKDLEISGVGYRANLQGNILDLSVGQSHEIKYPIPEGITITVADNTKLKVEGIDKQLVGQVAADIYHTSPMEPYKGKGVRIIGRYVRRKEGKKTS